MRTVLAAIAIFAAVSASAADPLPQVFSCGTQGSVGGLGAGTDLTRYTIDTAKFPEAVCNDGTPGVFYYGGYTKDEDRDKWIIFLQGGGSCVDGQSCAERWCSIDTNYGLDKMTSSLTKQRIRGNGFMSPDPQNKFGSWNRVLVFYCSSDTWVGTSVTTVTASLQGGPVREYQISFKGSRIIDAVLDTLRNANAQSRRRVVHHGDDGEPASEATSAWPDLDLATKVMFAGSSAGGAGLRMNLDRVAAKLRATNPAVDIRGVSDAAYGTLNETANFSNTTYCAKDPVRGCSYDTFMSASYDVIQTNTYGSRLDESCLQLHAATATQWRCGDGEHVIHNHLTTPFFIRQDLQDPQVGGENFVDVGFGTPSDFARRVEDELSHPQTPPEEPRPSAGLFVPQCGDHEAFTNDDTVFRVRIGAVNWHDTMWNWWTGAQPQQAIRHFTGTPGDAPECPP